MKFAITRTKTSAQRKGRHIVFTGLAAVGLSLSLFGCDGGKSSASTQSRLVYTESNEPGQNAILAFRADSSGNLTTLAGSPFDLRGQGLPNPTETIGPPDNDQQIITTSDHKLLFAVNGGSNTIAVMKVNTDGTLTHISGSPFASGGINPVSLALLNNKLYCANKNVASGAGGSGSPTYTVFNVASDGTLTQIPGATATANPGASAAQILASPDGKTMFTNDFFAVITTPTTGPLRSWKINSDGSLTQNGAALTPPVPVPAGTPDMFAPLYALVQGVQVHPTQRIVYACSPITHEVGVYTYDSSGAMTFNSFASSAGVANCWIKINKSASRMYTSNTGDDSISVFDLSNPLAPREVQHLQLQNAGATYVAIPNILTITSSGSAELSLTPDEKYLYVVSHRMNPDPTYHGGNYMHVLKVNSDGTVTEQGAAVNLNLTDAAHPHGVVVF